MKKLLAAGAAVLLLAACSPNEENGGQQTPAQPEETERPMTQEMTVSVEGQDETIEMELVNASNNLYSFYMDSERYTLESDGEKNVLRPKAQAPETYPDVFIEFAYLENDAMENALQQYAEEYSFPLEKQNDDFPAGAAVYHGTAGSAPDSETATIRLLDVQDGILAIRENYFLEAQEGHGARFHQMLETLETK